MRRRLTKTAAAAAAASALVVGALNLPTGSPPTPRCARQPSDGGTCLCAGRTFGKHSSCKHGLATGQCELFECEVGP